MAKKPQPPRPSKKPYAAPKLIKYGEVHALVQAGTAGNNEATGMPLATRMATSARTTKESIVRIGLHPLGIGLYLFDYKSQFRDAYGHGRQFGVMADEVECVMPAAITMNSDGHKMVDYAMLGIRHSIR